MNIYPVDSEGSHKYKTLLLKKNFLHSLPESAFVFFLLFFIILEACKEKNFKMAITLSF